VTDRHAARRTAMPPTTVPVTEPFWVIDGGWWGRVCWSYAVRRWRWC
jgi:hypothetical protein